MESLVLFAAVLLVSVVVASTPSVVFAMRPPRRRLTRILCFLCAAPSLAGGIALLLADTGPFRLIGLGYAVASPVSVLRSLLAARRPTSTPESRRATR